MSLKNDHLFQEKNIFSEEMYCKGIYPACRTETDVFVKKADPETCEEMSIVVPLRAWSIYVMRFPQKIEKLKVGIAKEDPRALPVGGSCACPVDEDNSNLPYLEEITLENNEFKYTCNAEGEYLVMNVGTKEKTEVYIGESPILLGFDTDDEWFHAPMAGDLNGNEGSWGKWDWTSDEVIENCYEPLRAKYPDYITRKTIGKDETGTYDMWCYTFEPKDYEQVIFVTSGIHASEMDGYLGLARFVELMCNEDGSHAGLHYLRTKVKIVMVPLVNVWAASVTHTRRNSSDVDLNRDFEYHTQAETLNVLWLLEQHKKEVSALIDYHTSQSFKLDLYYQFSIQAPNAPMCLRVTNHIYEDLKKRGIASPPNVSYIPGAYNKQNKYLQGYVWNHYHIPTLVVEHEHRKYYPMHSAENLQLAAEYYGNFMIQTVLEKYKLVK